MPDTNLGYMAMSSITCNTPIRVFGVEFENIYEVIRYSGSGKAKNGVYVDDDSQRYPCFDYEDYASENRYYRNFVFAKSKKDLEKKMVALRKVDSSTNYDKLTEDLAPMIYWGGDTIYEVMQTDNMDGSQSRKKSFVGLLLDMFFKF